MTREEAIAAAKEKRTVIPFEDGEIKADALGWVVTLHGTPRYFGTIEGAISYVLRERVRMSGKKNLQDLLEYLSR